MVTITCDTCGAKRQGNEEWLLGFDLEFQSPRSLRRSLTFLDRWDNRRINELGSIHLCSIECKDEYVEKSKAA